MKLHKKTVLAFALTAVMATGALTACGGQVGENYPEYEDDKSMWIGGWDQPLNTEADYKLAKEMGLTHMFVDGWTTGRHNEEFYDQLRNCEKAGLKAIVQMDTAGGNPNGYECDTYDYSVFPAVDMINVWDEPSWVEFPDVADRVEKMNELYAGKDITVFVNANPYAPEQMLPTEIRGDMLEYLTKFNDEVMSKIQGRKIYSTDYYALQQAHGEYFIETVWLNYMSMFAHFAKENDGEFHMFIQNYSDAYRRELVGKEDLSFQIYTDMAFGISGFTYFTYRKSNITGFDGGCVDNKISCKRNESWYWAKEMNEEISAFDHVYLSFDWNGVMAVNGQENLADDEEYENPCFNIYQALESLDCAKSVTATQDTIIGQFKDADGRDGLIVTNFTNPTDGLKDTVSFEFKNANRAIVYRGGERKIYEVKDNKLDIKLATGEGVFVIPVKL